MKNNRRGVLIILSSPSGAGKSSLAQDLIKWDHNIVFSISSTTRDARPGEKDGREYNFTSIGKFKAMVASKKMLEHAEVFGNLYGSPLEPVEQALNSGKDVLFDIDWQGGQQISNSSLQDDVISFFILPPSIKELELRLHNRAQDSSKVVRDRMKKSKSEISHWGEYDYVLINDSLDVTSKAIKNILCAERMRRSRQPKLVEHVRNLQNEYNEIESKS
tara:strand:+ start:142 stop:795 length:654 start_codon:yes stop_codon:yes gene_type:complete